VRIKSGGSVLKKFTFIFVSILLIPTLSLAEPESAKAITTKNSKCVVKRAAGEYPTYRVLKNGKAIFEPQSDGIVAALVSPSGKYVALSAGETDLIDLESGKFEYGVVVINCATGNKKGYRKGIPTLILKWNGDSSLQISDVLNLSGNSGETLP
jgi:hypothetical protein